MADLPERLDEDGVTHRLLVRLAGAHDDATFADIDPADQPEVPRSHSFWH